MLNNITNTRHTKTTTQYSFVVSLVCLSKTINCNYLVNESSYQQGKFQTFGPSLDFKHNNGVGFNVVRAIFYLHIWE